MSFYRLILAVSLFALSTPSFALINVGDSVPNLSWRTVDDTVVNLDEVKASVKVLLYNGGFCGPCNSEFQELVPKVKQFDGQSVEFISLSVAGWSSSSNPTVQFLKEWKAKHNIPFLVAAAPRNEGSQFFSKVYLPNVVIVDGSGKLAYKAINPGVSKLFAEVRKALAK